MDVELLRVEEAARILSIGRSKMYAMIASGEIPSLRVGRRSLRVSTDALRAWIEQLGRLGPTGHQGTSDIRPRRAARD
jgi:excisionase family DNA binding protein